MNRRGFLRNSVVFAGSLLAGCGSSGGNFVFNDPPAGGQPPTTPTGPFVGRVNLSEVGGQALSVISIYANPAGLTASGDFATTVSRDGAQLLLVCDPRQNVRALGYSIPGQSAVEIDAVSTTLMLVYVTRGILATEPQLATERLAQLRALSNFAPLVNFVRGRLPSQSVSQIAVDPAYATLLKALVEEWLDRHGQAVLAQASIPPVEPHPRTNGNIGLAYPEDQPTRDSELALTNRAWRYVSVYRQNLDSAGNEVSPVRLPNILGVARPAASPSNILPAANGLSWGSLFTSQALQPTSGTEQLQLSESPQVKKLRYYVYGPGTPINSVTFPTSVQALPQTTDAFSLTFLYFGFLPMLDFLGGVTGGLRNADRLLSELYAAVFGTTVSADGIAQAYESGDQGNIESSVVDYCVAVLGLGAVALGAIFSSGPAATAMAVIAGLIAAPTMFFSATNFTAAVLSSLLQPLRASVEIDAPEVEQDLLVVAASHTLGSLDRIQQVLPDGSLLVKTDPGAGSETVRIFRLDGSQETVFTRASSSFEFVLSSNADLVVGTSNGLGVEYFFRSNPAGVRQRTTVPDQVTGGGYSSVAPTLAGIIESGSRRWIALTGFWNRDITRETSDWVTALWLEDAETGVVTNIPLTSLGYPFDGLTALRFQVGSDGWVRAQHFSPPQVESQFVFQIVPEGGSLIQHQQLIWSASGFQAVDGNFAEGQLSLVSSQPTVNRYGSYASVRSRSLGRTVPGSGGASSTFGIAIDLRKNLSGTSDELLEPAGQVTDTDYFEADVASLGAYITPYLNDAGGLLVARYSFEENRLFYRFQPEGAGEVDVSALVGEAYPRAHAGPYFALSDGRVLRQRLIA